MSLDERFDVLENLKQGETFYYNDDTYMKLSPNVTCFGYNVNAINIKTGTMIWLNPKETFIDLVTRKVAQTL